MKKTVLSVIIAALIAAPCSFAWGRLGHITIQAIAMNHLTPQAAATIAKTGCLTPKDSYWLDTIKDDEPYKTKFEGWHASIATPDCKSPANVRLEYRDGKDGVTALEKIKLEMADYRNLPDSIVHEAVKCIVHIVGDMHCPCHIRYTDNSNAGKFRVVFNDKETTLHKVWDSELISYMSGYGRKDAAQYAARLDVWTEEQIAKVQKGWGQEWFEDAARDVRPMVGKVKKGAFLDNMWAKENIGLAELELQKAGYRLAAALNEIFK